jgi:hypothetical protein
MGVQSLDSDVRGFLYGLFNEASGIFEAKAEELGSGAEATTARGLSFEFMRAQGMARMGGDEASMTATIEALVKKVNDITEPALTACVEDLRDWQKIYFRHASPAEKAGLGTYSAKIF